MAKKKLSCEQISALLSFYAEGTLNLLLKKLVKEHLENCPDCMAEYVDMIEKCNNSAQPVKSNIEENYETKQYEEFRANLSAYVDNELSSEENLKVKKIAISNPLARKDLENIYKFKNLLYDSFAKTRDSLKADYSKIVSGSLQKELKMDYIITPFYRLSTLFLAMIIFIVLGFLFLLYF